jgi:hypothetical protein
MWCGALYWLAILLNQFFSKILCMLNSDHYLHVIKEQSLPFHQHMDVSFMETFFQQDRASWHATNAELSIFSEHFKD